MKKFLAFTLLSCFVLALPIFPVFALEEIGSTAYDITTSDVMDDLSRMYIDGKKLDASSYPLNASADYMLLLNVIEYAWDDYGTGDDSSAYGLYFYLYNPSGDKPLTRGGHHVQMSVSKSDFYVKYFLKLVSASDDNRFLKFKLENADAALKRLYSDERTYKISGIEIETKAKGVKDYKIAGTYTFTGRQAARTLECKTDTLTTIELDLYSTYYRLNSSDKGGNYYSQLDSVYFALDDFLIDKYGEVYSIQGAYTEQLFNTMVIYGDYPEVVDFLVQSGVPLNEYYGCDVNLTCSHFRGSDGALGNLWTCGYLSDITFLMSIFERSSEDPVVLSEDKIAYAKKYDMWTKAEQYWFNDLEKNWRWRPKYRNFNITIEDSFELLSFNENHNWLQSLLNYGLFGGVFGQDGSIETEAIVTLDSSSLYLDSTDFADTFYVNEDDVAQIKSVISDAALADQTVYLFHFNTQDFYSVDMCFQEGQFGEISYGYYTEETAYHNFDIMSISFRDQSGRITVLPTVSDPIDIVSDSTPPPSVDLDFHDPDLKRIIAIVMIVLVVLLVIWLIDKVIPKRVRVASSSGRRRRR